MKREDNMTKKYRDGKIDIKMFLPEDALQIHPLL